MIILLCFPLAGSEAGEEGAEFPGPGLHIPPAPGFQEVGDDGQPVGPGPQGLST